MVGEFRLDLSVAENMARFLFLSWPPYAQGVGARIVAAYQGNRIIYIDEDEVHTTRST
ncbi:hypothetical protein [Mycobacterium sp.]|uniref:hypothetical protein n=1 Tax=Mycobacterium sp. TaxID=1785 RepID=UPI003F9D2382